MGSKYIVPLKLLEINITPTLPDQFWHKLYYKNGYLKTLKTSEKDVVLDRPLDNFTLGPCLPVTASDTVLQAFQKLQCQISVIPPQVNSDWNATTGPAFILNKPVLSSVATSGDYNDLTNVPVIPQQTSVLLMKTVELFTATPQTLAFPLTGKYIIESVYITNASEDLNASISGIVNLQLKFPSGFVGYKTQNPIAPNESLTKLFSADDFVQLTKFNCTPFPCNEDKVYDGSVSGPMTFEVQTPMAGTQTVDVYVKLLKIS